MPVYTPAYDSKKVHFQNIDIIDQEEQERNSQAQVINKMVDKEQELAKLKHLIEMEQARISQCKMMSEREEMREKYEKKIAQEKFEI